MKSKETRRNEAVLIFIILLVFSPVIIWEHGGTFTLNDAVRIGIVPVCWYYLEDIWCWLFQRYQNFRKRRRVS